MLSKTAFRVGLAMVATATAVGAYSGASGAAPATRPSAQVAPCANGQIDSWLSTGGNGAAGTVYYQLQFTNLSTHTCSLFGYPGVSAVDFAGHQIGGAALHGGSRHQIDVARGATVRASLGVVETGDYSPGLCRPIEAFGFRVYAPNQTASDVVPFPVSVCSRVKTVSIDVSAVMR